MKKIINTRWRWLLSGLALSLALVISSYFSDTPQNTISQGTSKNNVFHAGSHKRHDTTHTQNIALNQLKRSRVVANVDGVFRPKSWYVPPPPPKAPPPPAPMAPPLPFTFLGKVQKPDGSLTIVIANKSRVFLVHGGETLDNNYHVDGIENGKLALTYQPMKKKQYLDLSGDQ